MSVPVIVQLAIIYFVCLDRPTFDLVINLVSWEVIDTNEFRILFHFIYYYMNINVWKWNCHALPTVHFICLKCYVGLGCRGILLSAKNKTVQWESCKIQSELKILRAKSSCTQGWSQGGGLAGPGPLKWKNFHSSPFKVYKILN